MTIHNSLAELIGNTPLVKLNHIPQAAGVKATIAVKAIRRPPTGKGPISCCKNATNRRNGR